jgi:hypothetical protein
LIAKLILSIFNNHPLGWWLFGPPTSYFYLVVEADELESEKGEEEMSENMSPDGGMVCTADDGVDLGVGDQRGTFEVPTDWGDDETTGEWEDAPTGEYPNVSVDLDAEPTLTDAQPPTFPEVESGAPGPAEPEATGTAITSEMGETAAGEIAAEDVAEDGAAEVLEDVALELLEDL